MGNRRWEQVGLLDPENEWPVKVEVWANGAWDLWANADMPGEVVRETGLLVDHGFDYRVIDREGKKVYVA